MRIRTPLKAFYELKTIFWHRKNPHFKKGKYRVILENGEYFEMTLTSHEAHQFRHDILQRKRAFHNSNVTGLLLIA